MRISREQMFMDVAVVVSKRSTCMRRAVGAVIVTNHRIVSIGYNGSPPGSDHCTREICPDSQVPCYRTIHAEANALAYLPSGVVAEQMFTTESPCPECASAIIASPIKEVYYLNEYRLDDGIRLLIQYGISVYRMTPSGFIIRKIIINDKLQEQL